MIAPTFASLSELTAAALEEMTYVELVIATKKAQQLYDKDHNIAYMYNILKKLHIELHARYT